MNIIIKQSEQAVSIALCLIDHMALIGKERLFYKFKYN